MRRNHVMMALIVLLVVLGAGILVGMRLAPTAPHVHDAVGPGAEADTIWTCSMHPQIRETGTGQCPLCGMDLIPVTEDPNDEPRDAPVLRVSAAAKALMNVQTRPVSRRLVEAEVHMVGRVAYDETGLAIISAWTPGRIERMFVDYTGIAVSRGDHMVEIYSPELLTAQEDLRRAAGAAQRLTGAASDAVRRSTETMVDAAENRLRRWGLTDAQIERAAQEGAFTDSITIYAPEGGTVIERHETEGTYVETGTPIYTIADLTQVWIILDAYESDLPWLRYGQRVTFTTETHPGEVFEGQISFIPPVLDPRTRTVRVRVNVPNEDRRLKPDMFVRGTVRAQVAGEGRVVDPSLAGKWISPMHPEIVKDEPGFCDVCGMPLVRPEDLGYSVADTAELPLVIPASAPLITGRRAVVYVQRPDADRPTFEGREVVLGPRTGDHYVVREGLDEGELVVTHGNFKIDSEIQILARPSMMAPRELVTEHAPPRAFPSPPQLEAALRDIYDHYVPVQQALAGDAPEAARSAAEAAAAVVRASETGPLTGAPLATWEALSEGAEASFEAIGETEDIEAMRLAFRDLSGAMEELVRTFGIAPGAPVYVVHCPMAFDFEGEDWLQPTEEIANPYFGAAMLTCGTVEEELSAPADAPAFAPAPVPVHQH